jgi:two-component system repressor protein LuxO
MRNIVVLNQGQWVEAEMLPEPLRAVRPQPHQLLKPHKAVQQETSAPQEILPLWQVEKNAIENALRYCQDNIPNAAALLEVSPSTIYRKIQGWQKNGQETKTKP